MSLIAGVDGRRGGWAVALVTLGAGAPTVEWHVVAGQDADGFRAVLDLAAGADAVGVDCPVGLPAHDWRACDLLAKRRLGAASARVVRAPPRRVLAASGYARAREVARDLLGGRGVSAQAYGLRGAVLAVDEVLRAGVTARVVEVHPELSFAALAGEVLASKKTPAGRAARLAALAAWTADAGSSAPDGDDGLDALAAAWSVWRH